MLAALLCVGGVLALTAVAGGAANSSARPSALPRTLGHVASVSASVQRPIGKRLVVKPHATYVVERRALARVLRTLAERRSGAWHPRLTVTYRVTIGSVPRRGSGRTLAALSRTLRGQDLITSGRRSRTMVKFRLGRLVLSPARTARIKRAVKDSGRLRITSRARFTVRFTARRRVVRLAGTPWRFSWILNTRKPRSGGESAKKLDLRLRDVIGSVQRTPIACQTRNELVRRLRLTASILLSGRRAAGADVLRAWIAHVGSMQQGGLLTAEQADMLRDELRSILRRVGTSGSRGQIPRVIRWPALPRCGGAGAAALTVPEFDPETVKVLLQGLVKCIPKVGAFLGALVGVLWPSEDPMQNVDRLISARLSDYSKALLQADLAGLRADVGDFAYHERQMALGLFAPSDVLDDYRITRKLFIDTRSHFQMAGYEWDLLPLYAQFENLYLAFIREAVLNGMHFGLSATEVDGPGGIYQHDFLGNDPPSLPDEERNRAALSYASAYVDKIHTERIRTKLGCKNPAPDNTGCATNPATVFNNTNADERLFQLQVADNQAMWPLLDPKAYPFGDPNYRPTRMIYSDLVGTPKVTSSFAPPANVPYPLTSITAWEKFMSGGAETWGQWWMDAVRVDHAPLTGAVTGDTSSTGDSPPAGGKAGTITWPRTDSGNYYGGAIVGAKGYVVDHYSSGFPATIARIDLTFANGLTDHFGHSSWPPAEFSYPDETLQAIKITGSWRPNSAPYPNQYVGDSLVFGFRYADSFYPSGKISLLTAPDKCVDLPSWSAGTQALVSACRSAASGAQDWTYNSTTHQLSSSSGAADPKFAPANVGTVCLQARGGGTTPGTPVDIYNCSDPDVPPTASQQWNVTTYDEIINAGSGLCVQADANWLLQLNTCSGGSLNAWTTPWTSRAPGAVRAPLTQACLSASGTRDTDATLRASGLPAPTVEMQSCAPIPDAGSWHRNWYYDDVDDSTELAPDLTYQALTVYGGTKCVAPATGAWPPPLHTLAALYDCNGSAAQKWSVNADATIRPAGVPGLCLERVNGAITDGTKVELNSCSGANRAQLWAWPAA